MSYTFFWRGKSIYWNENEELVLDAHKAALGAVKRGFSQPSDIQRSDKHPSRLCEWGNNCAWRLNGAYDVG